MAHTKCYVPASDCDYLDTPPSPQDNAYCLCPCPTSPSTTSHTFPQGHLTTANTEHPSIHSLIHSLNKHLPHTIYVGQSLSSVLSYLALKIIFVTFYK